VHRFQDRGDPRHSCDLPRSPTRNVVRGTEGRGDSCTARRSRARFLEVELKLNPARLGLADSFLTSGFSRGSRRDDSRALRSRGWVRGLRPIGAPVQLDRGMTDGDCRSLHPRNSSDNSPPASRRASRLDRSILRTDQRCYDPAVLL